MNHNRTMLVIILTIALFVEGTIAAHNPSVRYFRKDVYHAATQNWDVACTPDRFTFFANNDGVLMFDSGGVDTFSQPQQNKCPFALLRS